MRRELVGLSLLFLAILTLVSLTSFHPADPSIHRAVGAGLIHNRFGLLGAWIGGGLIGLFGVGAFWIPALILFECSLRVRKKAHALGRDWMLGGSLILLVATGGLFSESLFFGPRFAVESLVSGLLRDLLDRYASSQGAVVILVFAFLAGFIMATGIPLKRVWMGFSEMVNRIVERLKGLWAKFREFRKKRLSCKKPCSLPVKVKTPSIKVPRIPKIPKAPKKPGKSETPEADKIRPVIGTPAVRTEEEAGPTIQSKAPVKLKARPVPSQEEFPVMREIDGFRMPTIDLLNEATDADTHVDEEFLRAQSDILESKLGDFGVQGNVYTVKPGPVITTFEYKPAPGIKISKVTNLADDLALALRALSLRIIAPIPGKAAIGIEVPNEKREMVHFRELVVSEAFRKMDSPLSVCLGKDIVGNPVAVPMEKMPHLLIAGATGAGKSVGLNVMITSLLFKSPPDAVKLIMIDPKRIELSVYDGIPHLITPVVTDMKKATAALFWAVKEMERRYELLAEYKCRNITQYNDKAKKLAAEAVAKPTEEIVVPDRLPYIVIIIDELADLMMVASKDVEVALTRLAQMARAAGLHLVLATQRPSVDVLTGIIKANFPTRIAYQVSSKIDSRTILDTGGAEQLLGNGDMLYLPPGTAKLQRLHGAYLSDDELSRVIQFLKDQGEPDYITSITETPAGGDSATSSGGDEDGYDDRYDDAVELVTRSGQASISMVQRHLRIGYNRAARIIEKMEMEGVIGPADGARPREVLARSIGDVDEG